MLNITVRSRGGGISSARPENAPERPNAIGVAASMARGLRQVNQACGIVKPLYLWLEVEDGINAPQLSRLAPRRSGCAAAEG